MRHARFRLNSLKRTNPVALAGFQRSGLRAFTLAELLIALAILGVIATFTIPKVLQSQQDGKFKSIAKEAAGTVAGAYDAYRLNNAVTEGMGFSNLTPFINYVRVDTTSPLDDVQGNSNWNCTSSTPCLVLHNGAFIHYVGGWTFGGTGTTNAIFFHLDPDGKYSGSTTGPGKAVPLFLYTNGRLTDEGNLLPGTYSNGLLYPASPGKVPPWFSWD